MKEREGEFYKTHKPNTLNNKTYKKEFKKSYGYPEFDEGVTQFLEDQGESKSNTDNENSFENINSTEIKAAQNAINQNGRIPKKGNTLTKKNFFSSIF